MPMTALCVLFFEISRLHSLESWKARQGCCSADDVGPETDSSWKNPSWGLKCRYSRWLIALTVSVCIITNAKLVPDTFQTQLQDPSPLILSYLICPNVHDIVPPNLVLPRLLYPHTLVYPCGGL